MKRVFVVLFGFGLFVFSFAPALAQVQIETMARAAILVDFASRQVLYEKNADQPIPPASMSKLMTAFMAFDAIEEGSLSLDDTFPVSEKAWRKGGSKMYVEVGDHVRVEDLLRGIIIQSGNDACIVVAEGIAGTEDAFAQMMTSRARELGLSQSTFKNASGWPDPDHRMSVRDLATLATEIIERFPEYYHLYSEKSFTYAGIQQYTRNPLLRAGVEGVDGLKTGFTNEAGYGLVTSAERDGRRLVLVVAGLKTPEQRRSESQRLLEYGFRAFQAYKVASVDTTVDMANVWLGAQSQVPLVVGEDVIVTLSREARRGLEVSVAYEQPITAPIQKGTQLGALTVNAPGAESQEIPLLAGADIAEVDMLGRIAAKVNYLIWGPS